MAPVKLSAMQIGCIELRFCMVDEDNKFYNTNDIRKSGCQPLFLGCDVLTGISGWTKNRSRIHARFAKQGLATKLEFIDCRIDGLSNSDQAYFYSVCGLFKVVFEYHTTTVQQHCLQCLMDVWMSVCCSGTEPQLDVAYKVSPDNLVLTHNESLNKTVENDDGVPHHEGIVSATPSLESTLLVLETGSHDGSKSTSSDIQISTPPGDCSHPVSSSRSAHPDQELVSCSVSRIPGRRSSCGTQTDPSSEPGFHHQEPLSEYLCKMCRIRVKMTGREKADLLSMQLASSISKVPEPASENHCDPSVQKCNDEMTAVDTTDVVQEDRIDNVCLQSQCLPSTFKFQTSEQTKLVDKGDNSHVSDQEMHVEVIVIPADGQTGSTHAENCDKLILPSVKPFLGDLTEFPEVRNCTDSANDLQFVLASEIPQQADLFVEGVSKFDLFHTQTSLVNHLIDFNKTQGLPSQLPQPIGPAPDGDDVHYKVSLQPLLSESTGQVLCLDGFHGSHLPNSLLNCVGEGSGLYHESSNTQTEMMQTEEITTHLLNEQGVDAVSCVLKWVEEANALRDSLCFGHCTESATADHLDPTSEYHRAALSSSVTDQDLKSQLEYVLIVLDFLVRSVQHVKSASSLSALTELLLLTLSSVENSSDLSTASEDWQVASLLKFSAMMVFGKWLGEEFHRFEPAIAQRVTDFKQNHISNISDLPPAAEVLDELFPPCMVILASAWIGLTDLQVVEVTEMDHSYEDQSKSASVSLRHNCNLYPVIQLILELLNNSLVSGIAHVVYCRLRHAS